MPVVATTNTAAHSRALTTQAAGEHVDGAGPSGDVGERGAPRQQEQVLRHETRPSSGKVAGEEATSPATAISPTPAPYGQGQSLPGGARPQQDAQDAASAIKRPPA